MPFVPKSVAVSLPTNVAVSLSPAGDENLAALLAAPGADVFFDTNYAEGVTKDGSDRVSSFASRLGSYTVGASGTDRPTWGAESSTGHRGFTFASASGQKMVDPAAVLAGLYDGAQTYSSLWVVKFSTPTNGAPHIVWGIGNSGSTTDGIQEGLDATTATDRRFRGEGGGTTANAGSAHSTAYVCATTVYSAGAYSSWLNGVASLNGAANARAPSADIFVIGSRRLSGAYGAPLNGIFHLLILSRSAWTTQERQTLEAAAKAYVGTP